METFWKAGVPPCRQRKAATRLPLPGDSTSLNRSLAVPQGGISAVHREQMFQCCVEETQGLEK